MKQQGKLNENNAMGANQRTGLQGFFHAKKLAMCRTKSTHAIFAGIPCIFPEFSLTPRLLPLTPCFDIFD